MAIETPDTAKEIDQRMKTDVQRELVNSNPFLKNSWLGSIITSIANRIFDFYIQLEEAFKQSIPDTATDDTLERWANIWGVSRLAATTASGNIVATGIVTTNIPLATVFSSSEGLLYESTSAVVITNTVISVLSITRSGSQATVTTDGPHNLASNVTPTIAGANETEYNVTNAEIQVTAEDEFTYEVSGSPATPATGTITATADFIPVPVVSQSFGVDNNQIQDTKLTLQSPIAGVDNDARVDFNEIAGGTDQETDEGLRARLLDRIQNPVANFNAAAIEAAAKTVAGVTRVFVEEITPAIGQVTIYFMRDGDDDPIPTAPEVADVDSAVQAIRPANTSENDVFVLAPTGVVVPFTFSALTPNTTTMQAAIDANLRQFFDENTSVGVNVDEDKYRAAISNTIDTVTGDTVQSFTLSTPSGDISITAGEIGVLGVTTYP